MSRQSIEDEYEELFELYVLDSELNNENPRYGNNVYINQLKWPLKTLVVEYSNNPRYKNLLNKYIQYRDDNDKPDFKQFKIFITKHLYKYIQNSI